ncbi:MAG TPA: ABC transporter substrate-binding protein [Candidatus Binatia bacterium]|jgi:NitT/TauT family transport system substrate-binding protein|nr:ABC transporter substrate-binding protein [Candidatus Binatia bacterium]
MAQTHPLKVVFPSFSGAFTPLWMAHDLGLFVKHGVEVQPVFIEGGSRAAQAIVARDIDVGILSGGVIEATLAGAELTFVGTHLKTLVFSLYGPPEIRGVPELKGKTIGVTRFATPAQYSAILALRKFGLEADRDVKLLQTGGIPNSLAAMQKGVVQAAVLTAPTTIQARALGYREVADIASLGIPFIHSGVTLRKVTLKDQPKQIDAFLKGFHEATRLMKADETLANKITGKYTRVQDSERLKETYDSFAKHLAPDLLVPREAVVNMLQFVVATDPRAAKAKPEEFYDNSALQRLAKTGFFKN